MGQRLGGAISCEKKACCGKPLYFYKYRWPDRCNALAQNIFEPDLGAKKRTVNKTCRFCDKTFRTTQHLTRHNVAHACAEDPEHKHNSWCHCRSDEEYICQFCNHKFADKFRLTKHNKLHVCVQDPKNKFHKAYKRNEKPHLRCKFCRRLFKREYLLGRHNARHICRQDPEHVHSLYCGCSDRPKFKFCRNAYGQRVIIKSSDYTAEYVFSVILSTIPPAISIIKLTFSKTGAVKKNRMLGNEDEEEGPEITYLSQENQL